MRLVLPGFPHRKGRLVFDKAGKAAGPRFASLKCKVMDRNDALAVRPWCPEYISREPGSNPKCSFLSRRRFHHRTLQFRPCRSRAGGCKFMNLVLALILVPLAAGLGLLALRPDSLRKILVAGVTLAVCFGTVALALLPMTSGQSPHVELKTFPSAPMPSAWACCSSKSQ